MTEITWQQLQEKINVPNAIAISNGQVVINPSLVTGDPYPDLSSGGVIEFVYKLMGFCQKAQAQINSNATSGNRLTSFSATSFGSVQEGTAKTTATATRGVTVQLSVDESEPLGIKG
ncbi:MAG: hypothetical protein ACRC2R_17945 [Xenococcaceae cyanobacterium]